MPNFDKKGPQGKGPRTGRGLGKCEDAKLKNSRGLGRGRNSQARAKVSGNR